MTGNFTKMRVISLPLELSGLAALALAVIGIYGVTAYSVAQRTRELGLRTAFGAQHLHLLRIVIWDGVRFVVVGIGIGLFASWVFIPRLFFSRLLMNGVQATDPIAFLGAALVVFGAALAASYIPARRATRLDPIAALRYE
ncbi:MAG TPA: FtsX-like permease family protein [Terriglobia bacterium]|nr:FtsX-like permease family protein [Terriglobia bacterium]